MVHFAAIAYDLAFLGGLGVGLLLWLVPAFLTARLAERKGRSFTAYLIAALFLFWPLVLLVVAVLPRRGEAV